MPPGHKTYFKQLNLPHAKPVGGFAHGASGRRDLASGSHRNAKCSIVADFNGDGKDDSASIYRYDGRKSRGSHWELDLVIIYSEGDGFKQVVFPSAGQFKDFRGKKSLMHFLTLQDAGMISLHPGRMQLNNPAVVSHLDNRPAVIYYWNGNSFSQRAFYIDD